jgi:hypothetical protein
VSEGQNKNGPVKPESTKPETKADANTYMINMDSATMTFQGEKRRFSRQEAENVHVLMDILSKYAIESTIWWEQGQGQKVDDDGKPVPGRKKPAPGSLQADGEAIHISAPEHVPSAGEVRALKHRIAELEERLSELEDQRILPPDSVEARIRRAVLVQ